MSICILLSAFDHGLSGSSYNLGVFSINQFIETQSTKTIENVISITEADIIGVQESTLVGLNKLAERLDYYVYHYPKSSLNLYPYDTGLLSKYPIVKTSKNYAIIEVPDGERIAIFNVHLNPIPFELNWVKKDKTKVVEALQSSVKHRLPRLYELLYEMHQLEEKGIMCLIIGDFNEPSHLDWNNSANPNFITEVEWPVSSVLESAGFSDAYRRCRENQSHHPGFTWPANKPELAPQDRIDFIYCREGFFTILDAYTLGNDNIFSDYKLDNYNSDHRAVYAKIKRRPKLHSLQ